MTPKTFKVIDVSTDGSLDKGGGKRDLKHSECSRFSITFPFLKAAVYSLSLSPLPFLLLCKFPKGSTVFKLLLFSYPFTFRKVFLPQYYSITFLLHFVPFSSHFSHCLHAYRQDQVLLMIQQQKSFLLFRNLKRADDCKYSK